MNPLAVRVARIADEATRLDPAALLSEEERSPHLYVCGPCGFIDAVRGAAAKAGWSAEHIHVEHFGAQAPATANDGAFEVRIASSGKTIAVPAGQTVAQALALHGVDIALSCEQGVCGTCVTRLLDGVPDHRDSYLTDDERAANDQFTSCCSRARSARLVLDL